MPYRALKSLFPRSISHSLALSSLVEMTIRVHASLSTTCVGLQEVKPTMSLGVLTTRCITSLASGDSVMRSLDSSRRDSSSVFYISSYSTILRSGILKGRTSVPV